jgi:hypothetical protein
MNKKIFFFLLDKPEKPITIEEGGGTKEKQKGRQTLGHSLPSPLS